MSTVAVEIEASVGNVDVDLDLSKEVDESAGESLAVESLAAETSAVKAKKAVTAKKAKSAPLHPPYEEMIKDAIVSLKEKTGSSQHAIAKFIEEKEKNLPPNFKKLLLFHLKKLVSAGEIVKVKSSFKLPPVRSAAPKPAAAAAKTKAEAPPAKASRTSTRTSPGKRAAAKPVTKKAPVKAKAVKSPAKKGKK